MRRSIDIRQDFARFPDRPELAIAKMEVEMLLDIRDILDELCTELKSFAQYIKERR